MCGANTDAPLIVTAAFEEHAFLYFNQLREEHFPGELNMVPAHLSVFHHLPGAEEKAVRASLEGVCAAHPRPLIRITGLRNLGRGVAFQADSPGLRQVRRELTGQFEPWLTAQDRQKFQPHVTVQNKVSVESSRLLLAALAAQFSPWQFEVTGLLLWRYLHGPWELLDLFPFAGPVSSG